MIRLDSAASILRILLPVAIISSLAGLVPAAAAIPESYQTPPSPLAEIVEAPTTPEVSLSPDRAWLLLMQYPPLLSLRDLAEPELRLAGLRIRPTTNGPSRFTPISSLTLRRRSDGSEHPVTGQPEGARIGDVAWSPDSRHVAFTVAGDDRIDLWVAGVADGRARRLADIRLNAAAGDPCRWLPGGGALLCATVPARRGDPPSPPSVPAAPVVQENIGKTAPARTYQDLLEDQHDAALFEHYLTAQIVRIDLDGKAMRIGSPGIVWDFDTSPGGDFILVETLHRPFSYLVPAYRFPRKVEVWDLGGGLVRGIADLPLQEEIPIARGSVATGPRSHQWRGDVPATLVWVEALDGGDARVEADLRDRVFQLPAPFDGEPTVLADTVLRYGGITWGSDNLALIGEWWWKTRRERLSILRPGSVGAKPELLWDRSREDRYSDPGSPVTVPAASGRYLLLTANDGGSIFLAGEGASPEGNRPFFDELDLATKETRRLWRSEAPYYESAVAPLDAEGRYLLTRRESKQEPPNYFVRDLRTGDLSRLTNFPHPTPQLEGLSKELIHYQREDGVQLTGTLYLPPGYKAGDGPLPTLLWAYPQEFKSADAAGQVTDSPYRFDRVGWSSPLLFLTRGYAVLDDPSMPIVGEGDEEPNDTYVEQLVASARAAVEEIVRREVADRGRIGIGGHSYGAFMTANLLAHSDLFRAGIARSGAYNRTLTPFGFQAEDRTFWEAPEVYFRMSPFMHADQVDEPILLIHGDADNNSGTFPMQSERFYAALKGHGATARLVMLPDESHGYRARESILHMLWEMSEWLDTYVKAAPPRSIEAGSDPVGGGR